MKLLFKAVSTVDTKQDRNLDRDFVNVDYSDKSF